MDQATRTRADDVEEMIRELRRKARGDRGPTEIVVHAHDLWENEGRTFRERARRALAARPGSLLVHIIACSQLKLAAITTLLQVRREARTQGTHFAIRPSNRSAMGHLESIGLGNMLVQAA